jgi:phosphoglycolate phosphatase
VGYRLVLFDFDGTLADSVPWLNGVLGELAEEFGFRRPDAADLERLRRSGPREAMAILGVPAWKIPFIAARLRRRMAAELDSIRPFSGVPEVLRLLGEAGVQLAVVTSNSRGNAERVLAGRGAERVTHWACGAALLGKAARFRQVLARSGVPASEALCVGDEIRDARAARAAGIAFGAVGWGYHALDALRAERPREVFERVEELVRLVPGAAPG